MIKLNKIQQKSSLYDLLNFGISFIIFWALVPKISALMGLGTIGSTSFYLSFVQFGNVFDLGYTKLLITTDDEDECIRSYFKIFSLSILFLFFSIISFPLNIHVFLGIISMSLLNSANISYLERYFKYSSISTLQILLTLLPFLFLFLFEPEIAVLSALCIVAILGTLLNRTLFVGSGLRFDLPSSISQDFFAYNIFTSLRAPSIEFMIIKLFGAELNGVFYIVNKISAIPKMAIGSLSKPLSSGEYVVDKKNSFFLLNKVIWILFVLTGSIILFIFYSEILEYFSVSLIVNRFWLITLFISLNLPVLAEPLLRVNMKKNIGRRRNKKTALGYYIITVMLLLFSCLLGLEALQGLVLSILISSLYYVVSIYAKFT